MALDADTIVDRRRMRRKLTFWRVFATLVVICAVVAVGAALRVPGTDVLTGQPSGSIARVTITGHPRRSGTRGGARSTREIARPRRDRAYQ